MIALIPARGGSKGLPRKNILPLGGVPLIVHTLNSALATPGISRVVVSTDDDEIAATAASIPGIEVPFRRPSQLADDSASAIDVYLHAAEVLELDELCVLLPTTPLRHESDITACIDLFYSKQAEVVLSVSEAKPIAWQQKMTAQGQLQAMPGVPSGVDNRQDYNTTVVPNGAVYVLKTRSLAHSRSYFGPSSFGHLMPASRSIDIDSADDFSIAEALLASRRNS